MKRHYSHGGPVTAGLALAMFAAAGTSVLAAQQDFSQVQVEATHVAGPVYMLVGAGGNIAVSSGPDGALMVDDQFAPLADKIRAALQEIGQSEAAADLKFLLNTHFHGDHTGGNADFGTESTIIAHTNVRERLSTPQDRGGNVTPAAPPEALPVITFDESVNVHVNGERIIAIHVPRGHTDGDAVIHFTGSNVIHMGDLFFVGRFPFVDLGAGGSVEGLQDGIAEGLSVLPEDIQIIPGHGPLSDMDDLREYKRMLDETIGLVREQMDAGATVEQVVERGPGDEWEGWGQGFINAERWLQTIYQSLSDENDADYGPVDPDHGAGPGHSHDHEHEKGGSNHP
ncbi:MAG: MBL fold metallo-hydrolase [Gemmatimonadota bacterium]|nr:MBL fold metallo-hydrolase [Gemmatimonadota bacterium]